MKRILAIKLADLGDGLLVTPALEALKRTYPEAELDVLAAPGAARALAPNPFVDRVFVLEKGALDRAVGLLRPGAWSPALALLWRLRRRRYDALILFHHLTTRWGAWKHALVVRAIGAPRRVGLDNGRGRFLTDRLPDLGFGVRHEAEYALALVGLLGATLPHPPRLIYPLQPEGEEEARRLLWSLEGPFAALHPGSGPYSPARRWPPERFAAVADHLVGRGFRVLILGGPEEVELAERVRAYMADPSRATNLAGRTSLPGLASVLARCRLLVANDGGVMHLATAVGTPVVAVFGPTHPSAWGPFPPEAGRTVRLNLPCSPCLYRGHELGTPQGCPERECLTWLGPERVIAAVEAVLAGAPAPAGASPPEAPASASSRPDAAAGDGDASDRPPERPVDGEPMDDDG